ncbi:MAG TPA: thioredoxin domain-containing protein [Pseudolabrys sp.]|nr:thioredoxin domain-containing protein [Pseudolabrys sp.]
MIPRAARLVFALLIIAAPLAARADEGYYPIKADDGEIIANHRVPVELASQIEKLPGVVVVGNPKGAITLNEFYDLNCPYCRKASADIAELVRSHSELRLVLVPFPVLGIPSIQGTRVELAVARLATPQQFYKFHRETMSARGTMDGNRALSVAKSIGLNLDKVKKIANQDALGNLMIAHVRLGDALAISATPGFIIKGVAFVGYPGPKALEHIIESVDRCDAVMCDAAR